MPTTPSSSPSGSALRLAARRGLHGSITRLLLGAVVLFIAWRFTLAIVDYLGLSLLPRNAERCRKQWEVFGSKQYYWNGFFRWDAAWYGTVAKRGYSFSETQSSNAAFYPLVPYAARVVGSWFGDLHVGALVFVNLCTLGATCALTCFNQALRPRIDPQRATWLLLMFPTSFFLVSFFSESAFLCFAAASMAAYVRQRYLCAGVFGALAMASRSTGVVLALAYVADIAYFRLRHGRRLELGMAWLALIPAALGVFMLVLHHQVGEPLAFVQAQRHWRPSWTWPWRPLIEAVPRTIELSKSDVLRTWNPGPGVPVETS